MQTARSIIFCICRIPEAANFHQPALLGSMCSSDTCPWSLIFLCLPQSFVFCWAALHPGLPHMQTHFWDLLSLAWKDVAWGFLWLLYLSPGALDNAVLPVFCLYKILLRLRLLPCLPLLGFSTESQKEARHTILMKSSACKGRIYILLPAFAIGFTSDCSSETNYSRKAWVWVPTDASRMNSLIYNLSTGKQKVMIIKKKKSPF